jgi:glyoxylase-like metal-dependent hydrolase (beta-lactamase superfamily II)
MSPNIEPFFDAVTGTVTYIIYDEPGGTCAIIDPVLDYDLKAARTSTSSADKLISFVKTRRLPVEWVEWLLETHVPTTSHLRTISRRK